MYPVSVAYQKAILSSTRTFCARLTIGDTMYTDTDITQLDFGEYKLADEGYAIGSVPARMLELTIHQGAGEINSTSTVKLEIGLLVDGAYEYIPMGLYYIDELKSTAQSTAITCYDGMIKFESAFRSSNENPTLRQVVSDLERITGISFSGTLPDYAASVPVPKLDGSTCREVLGYAAALCAGNAVITRSGTFDMICPSETGLKITAGNAIACQMEDYPYRIGRVTCQTGERLFTSGPLDAGAVEYSFEHPAMTQAALDAIYQRVNKLSYTGYTLKWQGNPSIDLGDIVSYTDPKGKIWKLPVLSVRYHYAKGVTCEMSAKGQTETRNSFQPSGKVQKRVERIVTNLAIVREALVGKANVDDLNALRIKVEDIDANKLTSVMGVIGTLQSDLAQINTLITGSEIVETGQMMHLTAENAVIDEALVKQLLALYIGVNDLKAGDISTDRFHVVSDDGGIEIRGATQVWRDKNGTVRMQAGRDAQGNFTFSLFDDTGQGVLIDSEGLHPGAVPDGLIVDSMVSGDAHVSGEKLDINSVIREANENGTETIKSSLIYLDGAGQSLDVAFGSVSEKVEHIEQKKMYRLDVVSDNGGVFKNGDISTILSAVVHSWDEDVTDELNENRFIWTRRSSGKEEDQQWNEQHFGGTKQIRVTNEDVKVRATFFCDLIDPVTRTSILGGI